MKKKGFTLAELVVVTAIVGGLIVVALVGVNSARIRARDAKRAANMQEIVLALNIFYRQYGCLPSTYGGTTCTGAIGYSQGDAGSWDYSSQGGASNFLGFLVTSGIMKSVPVDPINNMTGDAAPQKTYAYRYFCYKVGDDAVKRGPELDYWKESGTWVSDPPTRVMIETDLPAVSEFVCK